MTRFCVGLSEVAELYDAFLVDQWGVLHNGKTPYRGAVDGLNRLIGGGKQVILVSNSGRRAAELTAAMRRIVGDEGALPDWVVRAFRW